jgi:hypothetical protein
VDPRQEQWDAYFSAGYGYTDATKLANLWNSHESIGDVKAEAGRRLLAGETLPMAPDPDAPVVGTEPGDPQDGARLAAYFAAGYDYNDAVKLAKLWKSADPYEAKIAGGKKLLAGETLPFRP